VLGPDGPHIDEIDGHADFWIFYKSLSHPGSRLPEIRFVLSFKKLSLNQTKDTISRGNHNAAGHAKRQPGDIDEGIPLVPGNVPPSAFKIIFKHTGLSLYQLKDLAFSTQDFSF
jgi:hypothetical protein